MKVRTIVDEDLVNYKKPSMFIGLGYCNWKCCKEANIPTSTCQNSELAKVPEIEISEREIYERFSLNDITEAIVIGGLEPFTHTDDVFNLIEYFRLRNCNCDFVIYTGWNKSEIPYIIYYLKEHFKNIIIKFGRYVPEHSPHFDEVLGVTLINKNQYAERIC